jgi:hypothetical protein|tara:strand:- start:290 stop:430 length:141 start_codon:yes stop_codon:yes gene_type:complete
MIGLQATAALIYLPAFNVTFRADSGPHMETALAVTAQVCRKISKFA